LSYLGLRGQFIRRSPGWPARGSAAASAAALAALGALPTPLADDLPSKRVLVGHVGEDGGPTIGLAIARGDRLAHVAPSVCGPTDMSTDRFDSGRPWSNPGRRGVSSGTGA